MNSTMKTNIRASALNIDEAFVQSERACCLPTPLTESALVRIRPLALVLGAMWLLVANFLGWF